MTKKSIYLCDLCGEETSTPTGLTVHERYAESAFHTGHQRGVVVKKANVEHCAKHICHKCYGAFESHFKNRMMLQNDVLHGTCAT